MTPLQLFIFSIAVFIILRILFDIIEDHRFSRIILYGMYLIILGMSSSIVWGFIHYTKVIEPLSIILPSILLLILGIALTTSTDFDENEILEKYGVFLSVTGGLALATAAIWSIFYYIKI